MLDHHGDVVLNFDIFKITEELAIHTFLFVDCSFVLTLSS